MSALRALLTVGSLWRFPGSPTPDTMRRVVMVWPHIRTVRMNGMNGGDWRTLEEDFFARHEYVSDGRGAE